MTAGTLAGTATSLQGDITNNAALLFNQSTLGTYASVISGSGSVEKIGSDTLTLSGANTYTGSTTINGGRLQLTSVSSSIANSNSLVITSGTFNIASGAGAKTVNNLSGTSSGNITLNENITINQTSDGEFQGTISGAGKSLTKTGANKLTLSGTNTYSGDTIVSAGTLEGNTLGLQGNITNNSIVNFNQSASDGIYSGIMSGTGAVQKSGTGTVILSGENTYSGGTTISSGTLQGTTTSLQGNITNHSILTFHQDSSGVYSGVISGTGEVIKNGAGTVRFSGANTYYHQTVINGGTLEISGLGTIGTNKNLIMNGGKFKIVSGTDTVELYNVEGGGSVIDISDSILQINKGSFSSSFAGTGQVQKLSTGLLTLTGDSSSFTGTTRVDEGELLLTGTCVLGGDVTILSNGLMKGKWTNWQRFVQLWNS